jgi:hypothetical protein
MPGERSSRGIAPPSGAGPSRRPSATSQSSRPDLSRWLASRAREARVDPLAPASARCARRSRGERIRLHPRKPAALHAREPRTTAGKHRIEVTRCNAG